MRILFIAPLPPPVTGNSLGSELVRAELAKRHALDIIDLNKSSLESGKFSFGRAARILRLTARIRRRCGRADAIYLVVAESLLGNLRDLLIYAACRRRLDRMVIHMLGGAGMRSILGRRGWQFRLNRRFLRRLGGVIVEGRTQGRMYEGLVASDRIHIVPNFAEDFLFLERGDIEAKFRALRPLQVLFLSNMNAGKGYKELVEACAGLSEDERMRISVTFAGGFESDGSRAEFLESIEGREGLGYAGVVSGEAKRALFARAHVFCLPTYYPWEGQPISILEAYAAGCAVVTTGHSGIPDVFADGVNGYEVETRSAASLRNGLRRLLERPEALLPLALANRALAEERYRARAHREAVAKVLESAGGHEG